MRFCFVLSVLMLMLPHAAFSLTLASDGQARATIVLPPDPAPAEQTAGEELSDHLAQITGAVFSIAAPGAAVDGPRILVGVSDTTRQIIGEEAISALADDDFIVRVVDNDLVLLGGTPRGTLYAVYSFLEDDLGCRWLTWYGAVDIPRQEELQIGALSRSESPAFLVRDICTQPSASVPIRPAVLRFLARNRNQGPDMWFAGDVTPYGGTSHRYGRPPGIWMVHTFFGWIPPDKYFAENPDFFSLVGGERKPVQLCFSNPELRRTMAANVLEGIGATDPTANFAISAQDDAAGALCECADCMALVEREGTPGAPIFDYLVELGGIVKEHYPQAFLTTLAYRKAQTEPPPKTIKLPDNVIVIFAPIDDDFAQPMEHPDNADTARNIAEWANHTDHLWVWYYPNTYGDTVPLGNLQRLAADYSLFRRVGVEGIFTEHTARGVYRSVGLIDLQTWLITKLMWDPDQDLDMLIADFTDRYYGAAAPIIREYSDRLETVTRELATRLIWNAPAGQFRHLTPEFLVWSQRLFDRAEAAVADSPVELLRVQQVRMATDLACILNWAGVQRHPDHGLDYLQLISRYRDTYITTARAHLDPEFSGEDVLRWHTVRTELKPLPPPLDQVPAERIRQFTPENARLHRRARLVEDPEAAGGFAAELDTDGRMPANIGFYDITTKRQQHAYPGDENQPIKPGEYHLYSIGRTALNAECYAWFDWSWIIQITDLTGLYDIDNPDKEWDIYATIRYDGEAYGGEGENRIRVDRLILVEVVE